MFASPAGEKRPLSLRSATYSHSRGPVPRPEVCLRSVSWSGHCLLFLLWCDAAQTQAETGTGSSQRQGPELPFFTPKHIALLSLQVSDLGCQAFAMLFDDIDHSLCQADSEAFSSFAHAQVIVTNEVYRFLGEPPVFLFCPTGEMVGSFMIENLQELSCTFFTSYMCKFTKFSFSLLEYCDSLSSPSVSKSPYLQTVGEDLLPNITVVWTGDACITLFTASLPAFFVPFACQPLCTKIRM